MNETITRHLSVRGRVQGVGYRNYIEYKAGVLGVSGWVRNRLDGSVEAVIHGTPEAVDALIECARRGPRKAEVSGVEVTPAEGAHQGFTVHATE
jgi:acylphosphatase